MRPLDALPPEQAREERRGPRARVLERVEPEARLDRPQQCVVVGPGPGEGVSPGSAARCYQRYATASASAAQAGVVTPGALVPGQVQHAARPERPDDPGDELRE